MTMPSFPEGWRPVAGDNISGMITDIDQGYSDQSGTYYPILTIEKPNGEKVAVHAFHTALKRQLVAKRVTPGEAISITMGEKRPLKNNPSQSVVPYFVELPNRTAADFNADSFYSEMGSKPPTAAAVTSDVPNHEDDAAPDEEVPF